MSVVCCTPESTKRTRPPTTHTFVSGTKFAKTAASTSRDVQERFMDVEGFDDGCFYAMVFQEYNSFILTFLKCAQAAYDTFSEALSDCSDSDANDTGVKRGIKLLADERWSPLLDSTRTLLNLVPTDAYPAVVDCGVLVKQEDNASNIKNIGAVPKGCLSSHVLVVLCKLLQPNELMMVFRALSALASSESRNRCVQVLSSCLENVHLLCGAHALFPDQSNTLQDTMPLFHNAFFAFALAAIMDHMDNLITTALDTGHKFLLNTFGNFMGIMSPGPALQKSIHMADFCMLMELVHGIDFSTKYSSYLRLGSLLNAKKGEEGLLRSTAVDVVQRLKPLLSGGCGSEDFSKGMIDALAASSCTIRLDGTVYGTVVQQLSAYHAMLFVFMLWHVGFERHWNEDAQFKKLLNMYPGHDSDQAAALKEVLERLKPSDPEVTVVQVVNNTVTTVGGFIMGLLCDPWFHTFCNKFLGYRSMDVLKSNQGIQFPEVVDAGDAIDTEVLSLYSVTVSEGTWHVIGLKSEFQWVANALSMMRYNYGSYLVDTEEQRQVIIRVLGALGAAWAKKGYFGKDVSEWTEEFQEQMVHEVVQKGAVEVRNECDVLMIEDENGVLVKQELEYRCIGVDWEDEHLTWWDVEDV